MLEIKIIEIIFSSKNYNQIFSGRILANNIKRYIICLEVLYDNIYFFLRKLYFFIFKTINTIKNLKLLKYK